MSRDTKLNPERQKRFLQAIRLGNYRCVAANFAGISPQTLYEWIKKGKAQKEGVYRDFLEALKQLESEVEAETIGIIRKAAIDQWQAAAWMLERKHYKRWGRKERQEITGKDGGSIKLENATLWNKLERIPDAKPLLESVDKFIAQHPELLE